MWGTLTNINISIIKYIISYKTKNIAQKNEITKNLKTNTDTPLSDIMHVCLQWMRCSNETLTSDEGFYEVEAFSGTGFFLHHQWR